MRTRIWCPLLCITNARVTFIEDAVTTNSKSSSYCTSKKGQKVLPLILPPEEKI